MDCECDFPRYDLDTDYIDLRLMIVELNITSGELLFEWASLDHVLPDGAHKSKSSASQITDPM